jgi:hypothetical protein
MPQVQNTRSLVQLHVTMPPPAFVPVPLFPLQDHTVLQSIFV